MFVLFRLIEVGKMVDPSLYDHYPSGQVSC